jgi:hypothetical protein
MKKSRPPVPSDAEIVQRVDHERRSFLLRAGVGLGGLSALDLLRTPAMAAPLATPAVNVGKLGTGQVPARAKRVICLHMLGAISHVDTFDYKPTLEKMHGQEIPPSVRNSGRLSTMSAGQSAFPIVGPISKFRQHGKSGAWVSDLMPYTARIADELCFIKSMHTEHVNHDPAAKFLHTGFQLAGRPSAGAWVSYALGSDNANLPNYVVMNAGTAMGVPLDSAAWGSGFLPSHHQGVVFRSGSEPVLYLKNPGGLQSADRRQMLDALAGLAKVDYKHSLDPEIPSRISQYEMAYRMQSSVPDIADFSDEPKHILEMYGPDVTKPGTYARNCLIARRLIERGVKYITLFGMGWDMHGSLVPLLPVRCKMVDQPTAALVMDLKQRGLLEDTLVTFGSEFGRTPFAQGALKAGFGRDHHGGCFTWWMAGGGVKAGHTHGETDEFSYRIVKDPVHIHDFNATLMHILGIDHEQLTFRAQGRDFRLTDVHGKVVKEILA